MVGERVFSKVPSSSAPNVPPIAPMMHHGHWRLGSR